MNNAPTALPERISHRHIEMFRAVMLAGGVTAAAQLLFTSQPTVSRELARLEQLLGYALFERVQGRLRPTARALALWAEVQRSWQGLERVVDRALELGQAHSAHLRPGTRSLPLPARDEVAVLPVNHPLAQRERLRAEDFAGQSFISLARDDPYRLQIDAVFEQAGVQRQLGLETASAVSVCALVQQGLGLAIVNPYTAQACAGPQLVLRPLAFSIPYQVHVLLPLHRPAEPAVDALVAALQQASTALRPSAV